MEEAVLRLNYDECETLLGRIYYALTEKGVCFLSWSPTGWQDFYGSLENEYFPEVETGNKITSEFTAEINSFFKGELKEFSYSIDLLNISPFKKKVLETAYSIPYGQVRSYGELAMESGYPNAYRAVGSTMRANRISLIVPCHRVVKSDGYIGGFGGRQDLKRQLLELEGIKVDKNFRYR